MEPARAFSQNTPVILGSQGYRHKVCQLNRFPQYQTWNKGEISTDLLTCGIIGFLLAWLIKKPTRRLLDLSGLVRHNYAGREIPTSAGVIFVTSASLAVIITVILWGSTGSNARVAFPCLLLVVGASLAGLIDDVYGSHVSRGLIGHLRAFVKERRTTTGVLKAVIIWLFALFSVTASRGAKPLLALVFDATLISLAANFTNLLDLRPARSVKAFSITLALLLAGDCSSSAALVPFGLTGGVLAVLNDELSEECMMGDAGANPLGAALGYWVALRLSQLVKVFVLLFLISVHIYSERFSLSRTIDGNSVLRFIDRLGRS